MLTLNLLPISPRTCMVMYPNHWSKFMKHLIQQKSRAADKFWIALPCTVANPHLWKEQTGGCYTRPNADIPLGEEDGDVRESWEEVAMSSHIGWWCKVPTPGDRHMKGVVWSSGLFKGSQDGNFEFTVNWKEDSFRGLGWYSKWYSSNILFSP